VGALQLVGDLRGEFFADLARRIDASHEAEGEIGKLADHLACFEFAQA